MKLHYLGAALVGLGLTACGLGDNADIGNETNGNTADGGGATGAGGATHASGGATHASGGATHASGGATHASGGATHASGGATQATGGSTGTGPQCGSKVCPSGEVCCNASCGVCTPPGYACDAIACLPADAGPPKCIDNVACIANTVWSPTECKCVPVPTTGGTCTVASDCHLVSDYCGGCNCLALSSGQKEPLCASTPVSCLIDPCMSKTVACVGGRCVAQ